MDMIEGVETNKLANERFPVIFAIFVSNCKIGANKQDNILARGRKIKDKIIISKLKIMLNPNIGDASKLEMRNTVDRLLKL